MSAASNLADRAFQISLTDDDEMKSLKSSLGGPKIRISNEFELRLQMRELEEDGVEWRFLAYAEEDKGLLESASQAGSYCSSAYLEAIRHNLNVARIACQLEMDAEYELIEYVIMATKEELSRLQKHPELFPNKDIREQFWDKIQQLCNLSLSSVISEQEARDRVHKSIQAARMESEEDRLTPGRDMQRKPWEQLLHNRAPGTEADLSMFAQEGSIQIIPMAAARILIANINEHKAIIRDIEAHREASKPYAPSSGNELNSNALRNSPHGHLRSHKALTDLLNPTIAGPMNILRRGDMNSLETLNLDFDALNRHGPQRQRTWNCVSVVLHDRPNYGVDSEQRDEQVEEMMSLVR